MDAKAVPVQVLEVAPDKKVVWALQTTIQLLNTPTVPEAVHFGDWK